MTNTHATVRISRPIRWHILTDTYAGRRPWPLVEARLTCTCGWQDKCHASEAQRHARIHGDIAHRGWVYVQPQD